MLFQILYNKLIYRPIIKKKVNKCGYNFKLGYLSEIINPQYFTFGNNFYAGPRSYFVTNKNNPVYIGNAVMFGPDCKIIGGNHDVRFTKNHMFFNKNIDHLKSFIQIEDGVWIGTNSVILSGANIKEGAVIGAMSLVNSEIPPYTVAVGIPAKKIKKRFEKIKDLEALLLNTNSKYSIPEINDIYKKYNIQYYL